MVKDDQCNYRNPDGKYCKELFDVRTPRGRRCMKHYDKETEAEYTNAVKAWNKAGSPKVWKYTVGKSLNTDKALEAS